MSIGLCIFITVWLTAVLMGAVLLGAYISHCKETKVNPVSQLRNTFFTPPEPPIRNRDDEVKGFYE